MRKFKLTDKVADRIRKMDKAPSEILPVPPKKEQEPVKTEEPNPGIRVISRTDIGLVRKSNQDAPVLGNALFGVADGMGGHNGGETASAGARDGMLRETETVTPSEEALSEAIRRVNGELYALQGQDSSLSGMGTTLTVLWPAGDRMLIGHVGDSRAYLLREGVLRQVTEDHSMVADMVRKGIITEAQAACHPMRNYITRAVGTDPELTPDILSLPRKKGDRWLVCSDGLHGPVVKSRLEELMAGEDLEESADQMIRDALDKGGRDNITLVILEDTEDTAAEAAPTEGGAEA